jgi:hypothetical protein
MATHHTAFPKPAALYKFLTFIGPNIVASEGEEWRRHRKIVARSFSEANHRLVWEETIQIVLDLFTHWDRQGNGGEIKVPSVTVVTREIAVMVIGIAGGHLVSLPIEGMLTPLCIGFGIRTSWEDSDVRPGQHRMVCGIPLAQYQYLPNYPNSELQAGYFKVRRPLHSSCCSTQLDPVSLCYRSRSQTCG